MSGVAERQLDCSDWWVAGAPPIVKYLEYHTWTNSTSIYRAPAKRVAFTFTRVSDFI